MTRPRGDVHVAIAATFFASGVAALIYQVAWQRILTQLVGVDAYSVTMIVAVFMLGLGLGGLSGAALTRRNLPLLRLFMLAEIGIGAFGLVSSPLLRAVGSSPLLARADLPLESAVYFGILVIPTLLMGISLPLLVQVFRARYDVGSALGFLYSANVLGAAVGALVAGFLLVGTIGVEWTCRLVAGLNLAIAFVVARLAGRGADRVVTEVEAPIPTAAELRLGIVCVLSVVAGAIALGYEIVYFRIFSAYFGLTGYVFPTLLAAYLVCLAVGNAAFGLVARRARTVTLLAIASAGAALATLPVLVVPELLTWTGIDPRYLVFIQTARPIVVLQIVGILGIAVVLLAPVAFLAAYFPLLARSAAADPQKAGRDVGLVYFSQTMGNTVGVLATGLVLLPSIGSVGTLKLLALLLALLPILFFAFTRHAHPRAPGLVPALAVLCLLSAIAYPADFYRSIRVAGLPPELVMESTLGVSLAYQEPSAYRITVGREGTAAFPTVQSRWNCSPNEFSALFTSDVKRALIIGIGPGVLPLCLQAMYPTVIVDVVELNPSLIELMRDRADPAIKDSLARSEIYVTDGRRFVNKNPDRRYDFIQIGVYHVTASGSGGLFTDEFQRSMRMLLTPNGVMTFNAYPAAIRATLELFTNVLVVSHDDAIATLFASNGAMRPLTAGTLRELPLSSFPADQSPSTDRLEWRTACVFDRDAIGALVSRVEPQRDDLPVTEFFLTKRQNIDDQPPTTDLRRWGCDHGARRLSEV